MKNLILALLLVPIFGFAHEFEFKDNRGRTIETYEEKDYRISIKDNRGRETGYVKDGKKYDTRGRKLGEYKYAD